MEFQSVDFLNAVDIHQLITTTFTTDKVNIISSKLLKYCFISKEQLYMLQSNKTYKSGSVNVKGKILSKSNYFIEKSFNKLFVI